MLYFQSVYFHRRTPRVHRRLYGPDYTKTKTLECSPVRFASFFFFSLQCQCSLQGVKKKKKALLKMLWPHCLEMISLRWLHSGTLQRKSEPRVTQEAHTDLYIVQLLIVYTRIMLPTLIVLISGINYFSLQLVKTLTTHTHTHQHDVY